MVRLGFWSDIGVPQPLASLRGADQWVRPYVYCAGGEMMASCNALPT